MHYSETDCMSSAFIMLFNLCQVLQEYKNQDSE